MTSRTDVLTLLGGDATQRAVMAKKLALAPLTDLGNAERFAARYALVAKYCPPRRRWLLWDGKRWLLDGRNAVLQLAKATVRAMYEEAASCEDDEHRKQYRRHIHRSERATALTGLLKLAESEPSIVVMPHELDVDPWLLNCANGTLDLRTGHMRNHYASDLITKLTPVPYEPDARSELWERVLAEATGDRELAEYIRRFAGYALTGSARERAFFFLHGPPGTAKSTLLDAFCGAMGDYALAASADTFIQQTYTGGNRGDLVRLAGARLVAVSEIRPGVRWDVAIIKQATGGDTIVAAAKYEAEVEFKPKFTLIIAGNDAPALREDDEGMWSRLRRIPLSAQIPPEKQDRDLKAKLQAPAHATAILAWMVQGCRVWLDAGLGTCAAVEASTDEYRTDMDDFGAFLEERCVFEAGSFMCKAEFNREYTAWCRDNNVRRPLRARDVGKRLAVRGCGERIVRGNRQWTGVRTLYAAEERQP